MRSKINVASRLNLESLETRITLDGHGCAFELADSPTAKASQAINCFATDVYEHVSQSEGNVFFSPLSLSTALAMTSAGARGNTATQMQDVMHLGDSPDVHTSFGAVVDSLTAEDRKVELEVANAMWPQLGWEVKDDFVNVVSDQYGSYLQNVDFENDPEGSREVINEKVKEETRERIEELIPQGGIDELTRLVLTNSIYFKGDWQVPFNEFATKDAPFTLADGETVQVPMMASADYLRHTVIDGFDIVVLEQGERDGFAFESGGTSMVLMVPGEGQTTDDMTPELVADVDEWVATNSNPIAFDLWLPKFETKVSLNMKQLLGEMGMSDMLDSDLSDFGGITDDPQFHITDVFHEAFVAVDEQGMEATAATAVIGGVLCFAAGTPVMTPDGEKLIETLRAGDLVLSRDEHDLSGAIEPKLIEETFENETEIVELRIGGKLIRTTSEHPFFVKEKGWKPASALEVGDLLAGDLSSWHEVEHIEATGQTEKVYNFRVADHHTYFVGSETWGFTVWTHNRCGAKAEVALRVDEPFHFMIRDDATSSILFMGRISDPTQESNELKPTVSSSSTSTPDPLGGDANGDNVVNFADFLIFSQNFGQAEDVVFADGDFNGDNEINFADFLILQDNFGKSIA